MSKNKLTNEQKAKRFDNIRMFGISLGIGGMVGNAIFGIWDQINHNLECAEVIFYTGTIAAATFIICGAAMEDNPYRNKKMIKDEPKEKEQPKVKTLKRK